MRTILFLMIAALTTPWSLAAEAKISFPVTPSLFIDEFDGSEGITFNARGQLFIGANNGIYLVEPDGRHKRIADVHTHLGMARIGERDILAADFGPTNVFRDGPNNDGIVWRITPEGVSPLRGTWGRAHHPHFLGAEWTSEPGGHQWALGGLQRWRQFFAVRLRPDQFPFSSLEEENMRAGQWW